MRTPPLAVRPATSRVRPGDPGWPSQAEWDTLGRNVGGRLIKVRSPLIACADAPSSAACAQVLKELKNPYYLGDEVALTQSLGWVDAWTSMPSAYAVAARSAHDVAAAVTFAREHRLRLVVKGGGHSYQGTSNAADSLLIWTRGMNAVTLHDGFVPAGCGGTTRPQPAVSVESGALWGHIYDAVTTRGGRYVQGGGCTTVGVGGFILGGGFGSWSKAYGMAAACLLEAEIVTADGAIRIVNECREPELFWALKGGGGGTFGVVTRFTLRTYDLPEFFGIVSATVRARSDAAFRRLIADTMSFYRDQLFNPHWGEQISVGPGHALGIDMTFQGLDRSQAHAVWQPFFDRLRAGRDDFSVEPEPTVAAIPARRLWDPATLRTLPGLVLADGRPGAPSSNLFWRSNLGEVGRVWHAYQSAWLPASLLEPSRHGDLGDALFAAARHWKVTLHVNKGLAGAPGGAIAAARNTAMNPAVLDAFALLISGAGEPPAYPGMPGHTPDVDLARRNAAAVDAAMREIRALVRNPGSYLNESDFFDAGWRESFWGPHYARLLAAKDRYDPGGLFYVHHGVGSERWSADGFTSRATS